MNKKDRKWFALFVVFAVLSGAVLIFLGCTEEHNTVESTGLVVLARGSIFGKSYRIVYDPDTGVEYYWGADGYLTPLYNADGSLKTYE